MRNLNNLFIYTKKIILKYYIVKMGNEESSVEEIPGLRLLSQGAESLWSVILQQEEDEGKCLFIREPGSNTQTDLCRAGVEVNLTEPWGNNVLHHLDRKDEWFVC